MVPVDVGNQSVILSLLEGLQQTFGPLFVKVSLIVGGAVGIYLILLTIRVLQERRKIVLLKDIRYNLDQLNIYYGIKHSSHRKRGLKQLLHTLKVKLGLEKK